MGNLQYSNPLQATSMDLGLEEIALVTGKHRLDFKGDLSSEFRFGYKI